MPERDEEANRGVPSILPNGVKYYGLSSLGERKWRRNGEEMILSSGSVEKIEWAGVEEADKGYEPGLKGSDAGARLCCRMRWTFSPGS